MLAVSATALLAMSIADAAYARGSSWRFQAAAAHRAPPRPVAEKRAAPKQQESLLAVVSIARQRITVYGAKGVLGQSPISSGRPGHLTPTGVFTVLQKNRFHRSNIYSGAPMPFMQRLTWSGIALHAGALPGFPASHGCIRLPANFAQDLWNLTRLGARVVVVPDDVQPRDIAHAQLPVPRLLPAEAAEAPSRIRTAAIESDDKTDAAPREPKLLNPVERAQASKAALAADAALKLAEAKARGAVSTTRAREANVAITALRVAERQIADASLRREWATKALAAARTPAQTQQAQTALEQAEAKLAALQATATALTERETETTAAAFEASQATWAAERDSERATLLAKSAERAASGDPVSILVSRKTGRVQVRQGWETLHDAPVTFKGGPEPSKEPLGTHVYVALEPVAQGEALRWISVSFSGSTPPPEIRPYARRQPKSMAAPPSKETAASVLDKFEIGEATRQFIAERLWTGATLIVSDQGPSHETGQHTDFVILAR